MEKYDNVKNIDELIKVMFNDSWGSKALRTILGAIKIADKPKIIDAFTSFGIATIATWYILRFGEAKLSIGDHLIDKKFISLLNKLNSLTAPEKERVAQIISESFVDLASMTIPSAKAGTTYEMSKEYAIMAKDEIAKHVNNDNERLLSFMTEDERKAAKSSQERYIQIVSGMLLASNAEVVKEFPLVFEAFKNASSLDSEMFLNALASYLKERFDSALSNGMSIEKAYLAEITNLERSIAQSYTDIQKTL